MERDQEAGGGVKIDYEGLKEIFKTVDYCIITSYMKTLPTFIVAIAFASCTPDFTKSGGESTQYMQGNLKERTRIAEEARELQPNFYLNAIEYFAETKEFYINIPFRKEVDLEMFERIGERADSVIFQTEETKRSRLPIQVAQQYFDLTLLDTLNVYDYAHHFVTGAKLARIEYYQPSIESSFIAVFKPENTSIDEGKPYYCTSPMKRLWTGMRAVERTSSSLTNRIINEFDLRPRYRWSSQHIKLVDEESTLSVLAVTRENEDKISSYLTQLKNGKLQILSKYKGEDAFWQLLPLPVQHDKHPVLLISLAVPDSDVSPFYAPFIWEKSGYKMVENKFHLNNY